MDDREQWTRIERIFHGALERDLDDRAEYLSRECAGDDDLRKRVESLLNSDDQTSPIPGPMVAPLPGEMLGHYRLLSLLGEGGMGTVYLARDIRLDRDVAVKIFTAEFESNAERKRRFFGEAKAASALNHPNIVTVHDVGTEGEVDYLVMEYVAGKPLDRLIPRNGLKLKEALRYGIQIADALACAHRAGIIHRDLKPANVVITESGVAKVVDFGIAKQVHPGRHTATRTELGLIFGTVAYMSPEQAEGRSVDARSDIFSFGSLLYEMVTGCHAFQRETAASTLAAVLREEPKPAIAIAEDVPPEVSQLIERCLRKIPDDRFQNMDDVKAALEAVRLVSSTASSPVSAQPPPRRRWFFWPVVAVIAFIGVAAAALWYVRRSPPEPVLTPIPLTTYPGFESSPTFSPDGEQVAFSWCKHEAAPTWHAEYLAICSIYIKQIGEEPPFRLTDTTAKEFSPAWSPDGKWIAFLRMVSPTRLALVLIPQRGGREKVLQEHDLTGFPDMPQGPYLAWTPDSKWVVCTTPGPKQWFLSLVAVDSEEKRILTKPTGSDYGDTAPALSPDGRLLAFSRHEGGFSLHLLRLSAQYAPQGEPLKLRSEQPPNLGAAWLPDGSGILFASRWRGENGLWRTSAASGATPLRLPFAPTFATDPAVSRRGNRLAYTAYRGDINIWRIELAGSSRQPDVPAPIISSTKLDWDPAFSPDGKRVAFNSERSGTPEIWLCDRDGSNPQQLSSFRGEYIGGPQWSPDGHSIALTLYSKEETKVGVISADSGALRVVAIPGGGKGPSWSRDGQWLYFASGRHPTAIWKIRAAGGVPVQLTRGTTDDMPQVSPDGKFLYYNKGWPGPLSVWRIPVEGGEGTKVIEGVSTKGQWTIGPDGVYFFATPDAKGRSEMRVYEFATGRTKKIMTVERSVAFRIAVSPDGRTIFYPQIDEQGSDLMLVENFR